MGNLSDGALIAILAVGGIVTWIAGIFLSKATDVLDDHFNLGQALGGMILLGIAGTLPEIAITVSAALTGALGLAVGNLLGGIAMQTLVLVIIDATNKNKRPLSFLSTAMEPMHEAALVVGVVSLAIMGALLPESDAIGPMSPVSILIVVVWVLGMMGISRSGKTRRWEAVDLGADGKPLPPPAGGSAAPAPKPNSMSQKPIKVVIAVFALASVVTLIAGVVLEQSGNALANSLGINGVIFGATVLALITALPEISTGIAAARMGQVGLAMGDIFGGNAIQITLFLVADILAGKPVLPTASAQSGWLAGLGILVTAIYMNGLMTRKEKKVFGVMGLDSLMVLIAYILGVIGLSHVT